MYGSLAAQPLSSQPLTPTHPKPETRLKVQIETKPETQPSSKKLGLALAGGGARGFAHIGVLKVLEAEGLRPDLIAGTSMGAIIGALYAVGYSARQLETIALTEDWAKVVSDGAPRDLHSNHEKLIDDRYLFSLQMKNFSPELPLGFINGQNAIRKVVSLMRKSSHVREFGKLPVPFLCVAQELETGKPVVLKSGFLPEALRASASIPIFFTPVDLGGKLLVDGGTVNNFPVDVVKAAGAETIIGVTFSDSLVQLGKMRSVVDVVLQLTGYENLMSTERNKEMCDVVVLPDMTQYSFTNYSNIKAIIDEGERAARSQLESLRRLSGKLGRRAPKPDSASTAAASMPLPPSIFAVSTPVLPDSVRLTGVRIEGNNLILTPDILQTANLKDEPRTVSFTDLEVAIDKLYGTKRYDLVYYRLDDDRETGKETRKENNRETGKEAQKENTRETGKENETGNVQQLVVVVKEKPVRSALRVGAHYDALYKTAVLGNYTLAPALAKQDWLSFDAALGDNPRFFAEYLHNPFANLTYGLRLRSQFYKPLVYLRGEQVQELNYRDFSVEPFVRWTPANSFTFRLGAQLEDANISSVFQLTPVEIEESYQETFLNLRIEALFDNLDDLAFPTQGSRLRLDGRLITPTRSYGSSIDAMATLVAEAERTWTVAGFSATLYFGGNAVFERQTFRHHYFAFVGGWGRNWINNALPLIGYNPGELITRAAVSGIAALRYEVFPNQFASLYFNTARVAGAPSEFFSSTSRTRTLTGYAISYGIKSAVGPIEVMVTRASEFSDRLLWFINAGYWF